MGTLCKNCKFKNAKKELGKVCTELFIKEFNNSCTILDINKIIKK